MRHFHLRTRYNILRKLKKTYDAVRLQVPKGRKALIEALAASKGESVIGYINRLIREDDGMTEEEWKAKDLSNGDGE